MILAAAARVQRRASSREDLLLAVGVIPAATCIIPMVLRFRYGACGLCLSLDNGDWGLLAKRREVKHPSDPSAAALTARRLLEALATHTQGQEKSASARRRRYSPTLDDTDCCWIGTRNSPGSRG